jgi:SAM-dependent methyltransferase
MHDPAAYYATRFTRDPRREVVWKVLARWLQRYLPKGGATLELGAGYCHFINETDASRKIAVDLHAGVVEHAAPGVETHVGSCEDLSFLPDASIDATFASNLFEHLPVPVARRTLAEISRVLKPGGRLALLQPNFKYCAANYFDDFTHVAIYTEVSLADFVATSGLRVSEVIPRLLPFSLKQGLPVAPWLLELYLRSPIRPFAAQMLVVAQKE